MRTGAQHSRCADTEERLLRYVEAAARADGWCDRSVDTLAEAAGVDRSTVYRRLDSLRRQGRLETSQIRIAGRLRTCHRRVVGQKEVGQVEQLLLRITELEAQVAGQAAMLAELRQGAPAAAANGEAERIAEQVAVAEVDVVVTSEGPIVVAPEEVERVAAAGVRVERRRLWPKGAPRPRPGLAATTAAFAAVVAAGEDAESVIELLRWYLAATIDRPEQIAWWGLHTFRAKVLARARVEGAKAKARHRDRLAALLRRTAVEQQARPLPEIDAEERRRAAARLVG